MFYLHSKKRARIPAHAPRPPASPPPPFSLLLVLLHLNNTIQQESAKYAVTDSNDAGTTTVQPEAGEEPKARPGTRPARILSRHSAGVHRHIHSPIIYTIIFDTRRARQTKKQNGLQVTSRSTHTPAHHYGRHTRSNTQRQLLTKKT